MTAAAAAPVRDCGAVILVMIVGAIGERWPCFYKNFPQNFAHRK